MAAEMAGGRGVGGGGSGHGERVERRSRGRGVAAGAEAAREGGPAGGRALVGVGASREKIQVDSGERHEDRKRKRDGHKKQGKVQAVKKKKKSSDADEEKITISDVEKSFAFEGRIVGKILTDAVYSSSSDEDSEHERQEKKKEKKRNQKRDKKRSHMRNKKRRGDPKWVGGATMPKVKNPYVFMDISIGGGNAERITFKLFTNVVPKTAENFRALCTGERGLGASTQKPLCYKGTNIHRIVKGFVAQGGDFSRGDGRGGESIYGGKFPDENFRLLHDQPGLLSMANSGLDSNGSQFFITFKALPHLDGKHVVFGKVVSGSALLKKLEAVGKESGSPSRQVKIVDCGEVSNTNSQDLLRGEREKKTKNGDANSNAVGGTKLKKASGDCTQRKKRKHYSSDSYSSDTSDSLSYSSDSGSDSESHSSLDTSSSSDHRRKRRKGSKKDKRKPTKSKGKHTRSKRKSRGSKRRSKRSYGSSNDDSVSSKTDSSSDSENGSHRTKRSLPKDKESTKMKNSEQVRSFQDVDKGKQTVTTVNRSQSPDGSKPSNKDGNGADDRYGNYNSKDRNDPGASSRINPIHIDVNLRKAVNVDGNIGGDHAEADMARTGTERHLPSNEPVSTNGKDLAVGSAEIGQSQRIRKGHGFTQKYGNARLYRTPSPERPPIRPRYDGGRDDRWNNFNRYGRNGPYSRRSPVRRYHGSPRASSPPRYPRRGQSRSRSRSPASRHDRGGYRRPSPRRSRSPAELRRGVNDRPRSDRGGGDPNHRDHSPPANRSRSKSQEPLRSKSPDAAPAKRESSKYNRRRSSSSRSSSPDGNKGLVSY